MPATNNKKVKSVAKRATRNPKSVLESRQAVLQTRDIVVETPSATTDAPAFVPMRVVLLAGKISTAPQVPTKDKAGWSEPRRRYILNYLSKLQMIMRLADWEIKVSFDTIADDDCYAEVKPEKDQRRAELLFGRQFFLSTPADQRQTLVHELMHLHLVNMEEMAAGAITNAVDESAMRAFDGAFSCEVERTVDSIADIIAPLLDRFELPAR